jgi:hypothetical protein
MRIFWPILKLVDRYWPWQELQIVFKGSGCPLDFVLKFDGGNAKTAPIDTVLLIGNFRQIAHGQPEYIYELWRFGCRLIIYIYIQKTVRKIPSVLVNLYAD